MDRRAGEQSQQMSNSCYDKGEIRNERLATGIGQSALSQQLAQLRRNDLIKTRRASKQIWYDLADDKVCLCVRSMESILGDEGDVGQMLNTALRLNKPEASAPPARGAAGFARII